MNNAIIITTINEKTHAIDEYLKLQDCDVILVGDRKSPDIKSEHNLKFMSLEDQGRLGYRYVSKCPYDHYARKNIGYLYAVQCGAKIIIDTDDDNIPQKNWSIPEFVSTCMLDQDGRYVNVYNYFTNKHVWPRGYPLNRITEKVSSTIKRTAPVRIGVWQGLANGDPDVDAIHRMVFGEDVIFKDRESVYLQSHKYCPFNSQNTYWNNRYYELLYLPATTSFRFTDILRSFVAQRLLWEEGACLGFLGATVHQSRNMHDYMKDFAEEIEMYLQIEKVVNLLESITLQGTLADKIKSVYSELSSEGIVQEQEQALLDLWLADCASLGAQ